MTTNMVTDKAFYTDSNGRDFLKRVTTTWLFKFQLEIHFQNM